MIKNIRNYKRLVILGLGFIFPVLFLSCVNIYLSLDVPKNIKVTGVTSDSAFVSWSSVKKAASYEVMWQIKGEDSWAFDTVKTNYLQINNLWYAQDYIVQVAAVPEDKATEYLHPIFSHVILSTSFILAPTVDIQLVS